MARHDKLFLAVGTLMFIAALVLAGVAASLKSDLHKLENNQIRGRNERISYQNDERGLTCRILGSHDRNDPLCSVAPSTTVPLKD